MGSPAVGRFPVHPQANNKSSSHGPRAPIPRQRRKYFQIPITLASSKRFFSQGALIINKTRNKLSKETFKQIIYLKSWGVFKELNKEKREKLGNEMENDFIIPK